MLLFVIDYHHFLTATDPLPAEKTSPLSQQDLEQVPLNGDVSDETRRYVFPLLDFASI